MKWMPFLWITLTAAAVAAPDSLSALRRQVEEQERQIKQLEVENSRLRYMLTEVDHHSGDPLYGTKVSGNRDAVPDAKEDLEEVHIVAEGDTLSEIAAAKRVTLESLAALNGLSDPSTIRSGQRLKLPKERAVERAKAEVQPTVVASTSVNPSHHMVRPGENLYRISLRYGIELDALLAANPAVDPHKLRVGQRVSIPGHEPMLAGGR